MERGSGRKRYRDEREKACGFHDCWSRHFLDLAMGKSEGSESFIRYVRAD